MLIYIMHENYLSTFKMPKTVSGPIFIEDEDGNKNSRNLVTAFVSNGKWYIKSNDFVQIMSGTNKIESSELVINNPYMLMTRTGESIIIYPSLAYNNNFLIEEVNEDGNITIGVDNSCDISLNMAILAKKQIQLSYKNQQCKLKNLNPKVPLFCNNKRVDECVLDDFDVIFIMGFKMIVCNKILYLSNDYKRVKKISNKLTNKTTLNYAVANVETGNQEYNDFYKPDDYFSKSPTFVKKIETYKNSIIKPNTEEKVDSFSVFIDIVPSVLMSTTSVVSGLSMYKEYKAGSATKESLTSSLLMIGIMLFASLVWPIIAHFIQKVRTFIKNKEYNFKYRRYIKRTSKEIEKAKQEQKEALLYNSLSLQECQKAIVEKNTSLFSININQERFLNVRLGTGQVKMDSDISFTESNALEDRSKFENGIKKLLEKNKYIEDAPYSVNLKNSISFINQDGDFDNYLKAIILQLITLYDYYNLKIVVFTSKNSKLKIIKNLRHCWSMDESIRFFATDTHEAEVISSHLMRFLNDENEGLNQKASIKTHYLIISDEINKYRNLKIIEKILEKKEYCGFSCLLFARKINEIPDGCQYFLAYNDKEAGLIQIEVSNESYEKFKPEYIDDTVDFDDCVSRVANIPVIGNSDVNNNGALPEKLGFLEMLNVGNIQQLNVVNRWQTSQVVNTLATPIGVDTTGNLLLLDLHEKAHGPHGLIAGMTGSGKSETIVTYLLSLAVNYSPNEVQFVLIDYKGGGLAGAFENRKTGVKLPHLVGTITNLDKSSMNRTLVSIKSELQRRQKVFNSAKEDLDIATIDIYKYQELVRNGSIKEPMSHLFIVCDEFAELKAQQPDFMDELVSAARIGRSLGIHLILATQKPSGVVDDQIWSNSKFKICAKVQTADDSNEMIRKPDAAYIKESGRFYLQVGYDEIFVKAQSGYTGVKYVPHESAYSSGMSDAKAIEFIDNNGNVIKTATAEEKEKATEKEDLGDELGNVTKYLIECAKAIGYQNQQLWLDSIPNEIYYPNVLKKYPFQKKPYILETIVGEYDDPANQKQGVVNINFTEKGNVLAFGVTGSGKTTLMSTIIYSLITNYSTNEVNIFAVDYISGILNKFADAPQVADMATASETNKATKIMYYLKREYERRLKILSSTGKDYMFYINSGKPLFPTLVIFVNGYDIIFERDYDICDEVISIIMREGPRVGMFFVTSSVGGSIGRIEEYYPQKITMQLSDSTEYVDHFTDCPRELIPNDNPGRGLIDINGVHEFQTALITQQNEEEVLKSVMEQLNKALPKAKGMPAIPKIVTTKDVIQENITLDSLPVGIELLSNCICDFNFDNLINLVLYHDETNAKDFSTSIINIMKTNSKYTIIWLDGLGIDTEIENVKKFNSNFVAVCNSLNKTIIEKKEIGEVNTGNKIIFVITGYTDIEKHLEKTQKEDPETKTIDDLIMSSLDANNYKYILFDSTSLKSIDSKKWIDYFDYDRGIVLACDPSDQEILTMESNYDDQKYSRDIATIADKEGYKIIKYVRR